MSTPNGGNEIVAPFAFRGTMDGDLFAGWAENIFVPTLTNPGKSVLLLDLGSEFWGRRSERQPSIA
jgi:hypothetical protein